MVTETKKQRILNMFNDLEWLKSPSGNDVKVLCKHHFDDNGLYGVVENSSQYCDVHYARMILQKMGYKVLIGGSIISITKP